MQRRLRFLVHKFGATATNELVEELSDLGALMSHVKKTKFVPKHHDLIVNWGCISWPEKWTHHCDDVTGNYLNHWTLVRQSGNRLKSLPILKEAGVNVPVFTTDVGKAQLWLDDGHSVIARKHSRSRGGQGLTFVEPGFLLPTGQALYVKYRPKKSEFRVHVFRGAVIDVQQKKRRKGFTGTVDPKIHSHANGWVFCRQNISVPDAVLSQSVGAVAALGLDFGATDVGWTESTGKATVYEVNTAPGLEGTTVLKYAEAIRGYYYGNG